MFLVLLSLILLLHLHRSMVIEQKVHILLHHNLLVLQNLLNLNCFDQFKKYFFQIISEMIYIYPLIFYKISSLDLMHQVLFIFTLRFLLLLNVFFVLLLPPIVLSISKQHLSFPQELFQFLQLLLLLILVFLLQSFLVEQLSHQPVLPDINELNK